MRRPTFYWRNRLKRIPILGYILIRLKKRYNALRNGLLLWLDLYPKTSTPFPQGAAEGLLSSVTVPVISDAEMMAKDRRQSLNKLCDEHDFFAPDFKEMFIRLVEPVGRLDRKSWEYVEGILGLERLGVLHADAVCLGIGSGCEKPIYYFANRCKTVISIDLYRDNNPAWSHTATADVLLNPAKYAPFRYRREHLQLLHMDATCLKLGDNMFDFAFSFSSIEHFGGHDAAAQTMREIERVLKPGGIACITTEFIINGTKHPEYFDREDLEVYLIKSHGLRLLTGQIDDTVSTRTLSRIVQAPTDSSIQRVSIVYRTANVVFLPILLFFRKPSSQAGSVNGRP